MAVPRTGSRDETDRAIHTDKNILAKSDVNAMSIENAVSYLESSFPYKPDQSAPDHMDGRKIYERDFLMALKSHPASHQKPENIPDCLLQDDCNVAPSIDTKQLAKPASIVTSIIKDTASKGMAVPRTGSRDETDRAIHTDKNILTKSDVNAMSNENAVSYFGSSLPYKPDQWAPDRKDGRKIYERDFILALKNHPLSQQKPENIPDCLLQVDCNVAPPSNIRIIKDSASRGVASAVPRIGNRDETNRAVHNDKNILSKSDLNNISIENAVSYFKPSLPYKPDQWTLDRRNDRKIYQRDFLLALKSHPASHQKPEDIPDSLLQDDLNALTKSKSQSVKIGSRESDVNANKSQPEELPKLCGVVKLHEVENSVKPGRLEKYETMPEDEKKTIAFYKTVLSIVNELTAETFETLVSQLCRLHIDSRQKLQGIIDIILEKAVHKPNYAPIYAMMCKEIQNKQVCIHGKSLALRTLLVSKCQVEFEKLADYEPERNNKVKEIDQCSDPQKAKELLLDLEEYDRRLRKRSVGIIRFIGELFKQQLLTSSIIWACLHSLLNNEEDNSLECFCVLLSTVGRELESKNVDLSTLFEKLKRITEDEFRNCRIRLLLQDVIELRHFKWIPKIGDSSGKIIGQIRKETVSGQTSIQEINVKPAHKDGSLGSRSKQFSVQIRAPRFIPGIRESSGKITGPVRKEAANEQISVPAVHALQIAEQPAMQTERNSSTQISAVLSERYFANNF